MGMVSRNLWSVKFISTKIYNGSRKVPSESRIRHPYVIINLLNRMGLPLSTCMHRTTPSVYLDLCQLWELDQCQERDAIPRVIFNKKELQPIAVCAFSELYTGEQQWKAFATVLLSPLHNLPGTMMVHNIVSSSQNNISSTWKLVKAAKVWKAESASYFGLHSSGCFLCGMSILVVWVLVASFPGTKMRRKGQPLRMRLISPHTIDILHPFVTHNFDTERYTICRFIMLVYGVQRIHLIMLI